MPQDISHKFDRSQIGTIVGHPILQKSAAEIAEFLREKRSLYIYYPSVAKILERSKARIQNIRLSDRKEVER